MKRYQWISNQHIPLVTDAFKASQLPHNPRVIFKALISFVVNRTHLFQNGWTAFWMRISGNLLKEWWSYPNEGNPKEFYYFLRTGKAVYYCLRFVENSVEAQAVNSISLFFCFSLQLPDGMLHGRFKYCLSSATKTSSSPSFSAKSTSQKQIREKNQRC